MKSVKWQEFVEEINILGGLFIGMCGMKSSPSFFCKEFSSVKYWKAKRRKAQGSAQGSGRPRDQVK